MRDRGEREGGGGQIHVWMLVCVFLQMGADRDSRGGVAVVEEAVHASSVCDRGKVGNDKGVFMRSPRALLWCVRASFLRSMFQPRASSSAVNSQISWVGGGTLP